MSIYSYPLQLTYRLDMSSDIRKGAKAEVKEKLQQYFLDNLKFRDCTLKPIINEVRDTIIVRISGRAQFEFNSAGSSDAGYHYETDGESEIIPAVSAEELSELVQNAFDFAAGHISEDEVYWADGSAHPVMLSDSLYYETAQADAMVAGYPTDDMLWEWAFPA